MRIKGQLLASGPHASEAEYWFSRSLDLRAEHSALHGSENGNVAERLSTGTLLNG